MTRISLTRNIFTIGTDIEDGTAMPGVLRLITRISTCRRCLFPEGIGGLLVPLAERIAVRNLIARLGCEAVLVSCNHLGTINHRLLSVKAPRTIENKGRNAVLVSHKHADSSANSNRRILSELLAPTSILSLRFLGGNLLRFEALKTFENKCNKRLHEFWLKVLCPPRSL